MLNRLTAEARARVAWAGRTIDFVMLNPNTGGAWVSIVEQPNAHYSFHELSADGRIVCRRQCVEQDAARKDRVRWEEC